MSTVKEILSPSEFNSQLQKELARIGTRNGLANPSRANTGAVLHEYLVARTGLSYFDKREKAAKAALIDVAVDNDRIAEIEKNTLKNGKQETVLLTTDHYQLQVSTTAARSVVDVTALCNELTKLGVSKAIIDAAVDAGTTRSKVPISYKVLRTG